MNYQILNDLRGEIEASEEEILQRTIKELSLPKQTPAFIYRRSLDTRKGRLSFVYSVAVQTDAEHPRLRPFPVYRLPHPTAHPREIPIVGFGPAGMFCAWLLAKCGHKPIVIERGKAVEERICDVDSFWKGGEINPESNVQFGEGGAGTFSDGKLTTRINDPRCRTVLETFVSYGAPREILTLAKPHIGTDNLRSIVKALREDVVRMGGQVRFEAKLTDLTLDQGKLHGICINGEPIPSDLAVLAIGNGARDTYEMLLNKPLVIEPKPFSVGFRAEHSQEALDRRTYGKYYGLPQLGPADYLFSHVTDKCTGEAVYSFCMCPGGQVVNASSLPHRLTTNGMSHFSRNGANANAAILASVRPATVQEGLALQEEVEAKAWSVAQGLGPATTGKDFLNQSHPSLKNCPRASFLPGVAEYDINRLFPAALSGRLREGFSHFARRILGNEPCLLTAPETRTSAPLRILRDRETLEAIAAEGLYPCGEGAGYAGGIMSSAVDGLKVAEKILEKTK